MINNVTMQCVVCGQIKTVPEENTFYTLLYIYIYIYIYKTTKVRPFSVHKQLSS